MPPPKGRKLMVICTTSKKRILESMEITECFNAVLDMPNVMSGICCFATMLCSLLKSYLMELFLISFLKFFCFETCFVLEFVVHF
jgi:hypothetical protein